MRTSTRCPGQIAVACTPSIQSLEQVTPPKLRLRMTRVRVLLRPREQGRPGPAGVGGKSLAAKRDGTSRAR